MWRVWAGSEWSGIDTSYKSSLNCCLHLRILEIDQCGVVSCRMAISMDGTCTGEHGIGIGKRRFLPKQLGDVNLDIMRSIKNSLDPKQLMNTGKVV